MVFLHPNDEDWPGMKPKTQEKRVTPSSQAKDSRDGPNDSHGSKSPPRRFEHRSAPLVSQDDLFLRQVLSEDDPPYSSNHSSHRQSVGLSDDHRDRGRDTNNKRNKDVVPINDSRTRSRPYDDVSYLGVKKPTVSMHSPNDHIQNQRVVCFIVFLTRVNTEAKDFQVSGAKRKFSEDLDTLADAFSTKSNSLGDRHRNNSHQRDAPGTNSLAILPTPIQTGSFASRLSLDTSGILLQSKSNQGHEEIVSLFRELSRLAAEATEDAVSQARDDKKLKAFTELSSMLSKVSSKAAAAVTSPLADILLRHAQVKQRTEDNIKAISMVWNKALDLFTADIFRTVELILVDAVKKITDAADLANKSVHPHFASTSQGHHGELAISETTGRSSNDRTRIPSSESRSKKEGEMDFRRDQKRRRVPDASPSPTLAQPIVKVEQSMHEILSQMKTKIDEQAQSLHRLTKENNELKASLLQQPVAT
ncbi:hypothetical protein DXG01_014585 [Tephrocybe rancida]|nr:hypothetical protein DXG01_014585 [Tephrocybe rancida]